jgi:predicted membrane channel-forming protein YqfA (hemolysin III family)
MNAQNFSSFFVTMQTMEATVCGQLTMLSDQVPENLQASAMFFVLMGVTWLPILFTHVDKTSSHYIFAIANSLSGLWLFLLHCYWDKALRESIGRKFYSCSNHPLSK